MSGYRDAMRRMANAVDDAHCAFINDERGAARRALEEVAHLAQGLLGRTDDPQPARVGGGEA